MNKSINNNKDYSMYEYKEIIVDEDFLSTYIDGYENFGWIIDENKNIISYNKKICVHFKRNRRIINKIELTRLQRNFDSLINEIQMLEQSKNSTPKMKEAISVLIGTVFMACGVMAITIAKVPQPLLCGIFSVPGITGWMLPVALHKRWIGKQTKIATPLIEEKYEQIDIVCQKGRALLEL